MFVRLMTGLALVIASGAAAPAQDQSKEKPLADRAWQILRGANEMETFLLDPMGPDTFIGNWKYLGKCAHKGVGSRQAVVAALEAGAKKPGKEKKGKFQPRYGIRATSGKDTVELLLDFELGEIHVFLGKQRAVIRTSDTPKGFFENMFTL